MTCSFDRWVNNHGLLHMNSYPNKNKPYGRMVAGSVTQGSEPAGPIYVGGFIPAFQPVALSIDLHRDAFLNHT